MSSGVRPTARRLGAAAALAALLVAPAACGAQRHATTTPTTRPSTTQGSTTAGSTTPSTLPPYDIGSAYAAVNLEAAIRIKDGGCWNEALPGSRIGSYRQDYYLAACRGEAWALDVQLFADATAARAGARLLAPATTVYTVANVLVVLATTASARLLATVRSYPGMVRAAAG